MRAFWSKGELSYPEAGTPSEGACATSRLVARRRGDLAASSQRLSALGGWTNGFERERETAFCCAGSCLSSSVMADDFVMGCACEEDARRVVGPCLAESGSASTGLELHPEEDGGGWMSAGRRRPRPVGEPSGWWAGDVSRSWASGITGARSRSGQPVVPRPDGGAVASGRSFAEDRGVGCGITSPEPVRTPVSETVARVCAGHFNYYGITGQRGWALSRFREEVAQLWRRVAGVTAAGGSG